MKIRDHHPIDPLPEKSWDRIKEGVFAELDADAGASVRPPRARRRWVPALVLAAASVAAAATWLLVDARPPEDGALSSTRIVTSDDATETSLEDIAIHVEPRTALVVVDDDAAGSLVVLEHGAAVFAVPPREARPPFIVQSGEVRVEVVGTRYRVERVGGSARVETYEGTVRVVAGGRASLVHAGEQWPSLPADEPARAALADNDDAPGAENDAPDEAPARAPGDALDAEHRPAPAPDARQLDFERAASFEASDPEEAMRRYGALARGRDSWAQNALYALARLELERGDRTSAERRLRRYLERFPNGVNAEDARALLARTTRNDPRRD